MQRRTIIRLISLKTACLLILAILFSLSFCNRKNDVEREDETSLGVVKKILYIDSYHQGYAWSDGVESGIQKVLSNKPDIELKIFRMDSKRNKSEENKKEAALKAKALIETWNPDIVIAADDNASKYIILPYFKDTELPFVFCGVNWTVHEYGFPCSNVTGMQERALVNQLLDLLSKYASGTKTAFLAPDVLSQRKEAEHWKEILGLKFHEEYVTTYEEWKKAFLRLQKKYDIIMIRNLSGLNDSLSEEADEWILENAKIPTGGTLAATSELSLITLAKDPEEQGEYAAKTALEILNGKNPKDIPVATNKKAKIFLNMRLAKKLGVIFPVELTEDAQIISAENE